MSDVETKPQLTVPDAKGTSTSEFKVAIGVAVASGLIGGLESAALIMKDAFPHAWWVPLVIGVIGMLGSAMAYLKSRSAVKTAIIQSGTAVIAAEQAAKVSLAANPTNRP